MMIKMYINHKILLQQKKIILKNKTIMITITNLVLIQVNNYVKIMRFLLLILIVLRHRENWEDKELLQGSNLMEDLKKEMENHI